MLWATHLVEEAERADRVVILHRGRVVESAPPAALMQKAGKSDAVGCVSRPDREQGAGRQAFRGKGDVMSRFGGSRLAVATPGAGHRRRRGERHRPHLRQQREEQHRDRARRQELCAGRDHPHRQAAARHQAQSRSDAALCGLRRRQPDRRDRRGQACGGRFDPRHRRARGVRHRPGRPATVRQQRG